MNAAWSGFVPRDRPSWVGHVIILLPAVAAVFLRHASASADGEDGASSLRIPIPSTSLESELRESLQAAFPARAADRRERLVIHTDLAAHLAPLELQLESSQVLGTYRDEFPVHQRLELVIRGAAESQVAFLSGLLRAPRPIRVVRLDWQRGSGPGSRLLTLRLDVLLDAEADDEE